jgi:hypothetical protein
LRRTSRLVWSAVGMAESKVVYRPREGATAESELSALVAAYRYVIFDCPVNEKGARPGTLDDAEGLKNGRTDTEIIPG